MFSSSVPIPKGDLNPCPKGLLAVESEEALVVVWETNQRGPSRWVGVLKFEVEIHTSHKVRSVKVWIPGYLCLPLVEGHEPFTIIQKPKSNIEWRRLKY